jgi:thiol:disulfide interchange protein DsbD
VAFAQIGTPEEVLDASVYPVLDGFHPETNSTLIVEIRINQGYHINSNKPLEPFLIPTEISFEGEGQAAFGRVQYPEPKVKKFQFSENPLSIYEGTIYVPVTVSILSDVPGGESWVTTRVHFQGCTDEVCLLPMTKEIRTPIRIVPVSVPVNPINRDVWKAAGLGPSEESAISESGEISALFSEKGGILPFLLIYVGGLALNLTPCVYPLIPITIGIFMMQKGGHRRRQTVAHAFTYVFGLALTYSALGLLAALTGGMFGSAVQHPAAVLLIAAVLLGLALGMFGLYDLRPPEFLLRFSARQKTGYFGTLFMGLTAGIIAAPCVGPFVLGLLTFVGEQGDPAFGFLLFFIFAMGLGTPFLFLGIFTQSLSRIPKSGSWLVFVKKTFGVVLVGMALYYLRPLVPGEKVFQGMVYVTAVSAAIYLIRSEAGRSVFSAERLIRTTVALGVTALGVFVLSPPGETKGGIPWEPISAERLEQARLEGKPVIIDFFADWCLPCVELDKFTFSDETVTARAERFVTLKADLTRTGNEEMDRFKRQFDVRGVPTVVFLQPDGTELRESRILGFVNKDEFLNRMSAVFPG